MAEPQDVTVAFSHDAHFHCSYNGTTAAPFWVIDDEVYTIDRLPGRHSYYYSNQVLTVRRAQLSDSGRTYRCSFIDVESRVATLTVLGYKECECLPLNIQDTPLDT